MVDPGSADNTTDGVLALDGVGEPLQDHNANAFSAAVSIGPRIKSETLSIWAEKAHLVHRKHGVRGQNEVRATDNGLVLLSASFKLTEWD